MGNDETLSPERFAIAAFAYLETASAALADAARELDRVDVSPYVQDLRTAMMHARQGVAQLRHEVGIRSGDLVTI